MNLRFIKRIASSPWRIIASPKIEALRPLIPSELYLKCMYRSALGRKADLKNPKNYNEKLQWLKLHDRDPRYTRMVDKLAAKDYVSERIGPEYIIPTLGVWDRVEDIDFDALPERFVLKCTHDSAGLVICTDRAAFDIPAAKEKLRRCLKRNFYYSGREWPYKNVPRRIIAEAYMEDETFHELRDYKIFTFGGEPKLMHLVSNRQNAQEETYGDFYDAQFNHVDLTMGHSNAPQPPEKPQNFEKMLSLARILAKDTAHLRVDFYEVNGHVYFGELTFFQDSGLADVQPPHWNRTLGEWIPAP